MKNNRRTLLYWFTAVFSGLMFRRIFSSGKKEEVTTMKFLSHDGKLVEVDSKYISRKKRSVEKEEIKNWVQRN
ncbi:hypothetical protein [Flavihumibacter solisilvae]|uniref:Uncharacterized protein n=1 Tax=Flavihumibacter solisilvae TaxID=1349421 RepID=A0A0C1IVV7_9BACT|nr:hypothetical protein [Flavihumibacter solisilvae]KIC94604.1 hypothetical protein OI18_10915 [Flavihumibacter solisilvae]